MAVPNPTAVRPAAKKGVNKSATPATLAMFPAVFDIQTLYNSASYPIFKFLNASMEARIASM